MKYRFGIKSVLKIAAAALFAGFVGIQFIPTIRNQSDVVPDTDFIKSFKPPENIVRILMTSCYDCHSNNTAYPWYNRIQPAASFMEGHITHAKEEMNFSEFGSYSKRRQSSKLRSMISKTESGEMPLPSYTFLHWDAKLSVQNKKELEKWITKLRGSTLFDAGP